MRKLWLLILLGFGLNPILMAQTNVTTGYQPADQAEDFHLKATDGKKYKLADFTGVKGFIVVFTCNSCPFSQAYEDRLIQLHQKYAPKGVPVIAINPNDPKRSPEDSYEKMIVRASEHKYPFTYLYDAKQKTAKKFGAARTPHVFFLSQHLQVLYIGAIDDNFEEPEQVKEKYLENAINNYLNGQTINPAQTKAIGCGIKWKKK